MKKFWKETDGGLVEYIILLSIIGVIVAVIGWRMYDQGWIIEQIATDHYGVALGENDLPTVDGVVAVQPLGDPIITVLPASPPYTTNTELKFAATSFGGKPPYTYTWTNYSGGKADGSMGDPIKFPEGTNEIKVKVKDANGTEKTSSLSLNITKGLDFAIVPKKGDGSNYAPPYNTGTPIRFDAVPVNQVGSYNCTWSGEYIGNSDCTGTVETYAESKVVDINVKLCDSTGTCVTKQQSISIGEAPLQGVVTADPGTSITNETLVKLKVDVSGGSGVYDITWDNYTGGVNANGAYGNEVQYASGSRVVKATICDVNMPELACITPTITLNVTVAPPTFTPVKVSISSNSNRNHIFTNENIKFMAMATGGQGEKTITWSGYSGGSSTSGAWGSDVTFTTGTKTIAATACDTAGNCASQTITVNVVSYVPFNANIESDPNRAIWDVEQVRFRANITGGTGNFALTWTNYSGGSSNNSTYGTAQSYPAGDHTISVKVCDLGVENYPCETFTKDLTVKAYKPITAKVVGEREVVWKDWGNMQSQRYWTNKSVYYDTIYGEVFKANTLHNSGVNSAIFDYSSKSTLKNTVYDGELYTMEIYLKSNKTISGKLRFAIAEWCDHVDDICARVSSKQDITLTTSWKKFTVKLRSNIDSTEAGYVAWLQEFPEGTEIHAAKPSIDADFKRGEKTYDYQNVHFKTKIDNGSGKYTVTWSSNYNGSNENFTWGEDKKFPGGVHTVSATICDAIVTNQACVTASNTFTVHFDPIDATIVSEHDRDIYDVEPTRFKAVVTGGSGQYELNWTNYPGYPMSNNLWGLWSKYSKGTQTITLEVCDKVAPGNPCSTFTKTINVLKYVPITAELIPEKEVVWREWGENWNDGFNDSVYDYFTNEKVQRVAGYNDVLIANVKNYGGTHVFINNSKHANDRRWKVKANKEYEFEIYLKADVAVHGTLHSTMDIKCDTSAMIAYPRSEGQAVTLTNVWKKFTMKQVAPCTGDAAWSFLIFDLPEGSEIQVARPSMDIGFENTIPHRIYDFQNLRFKTKTQGGSGSYNITWTNYTGGKSTDNTWGDQVTYTPGFKTVTAQICDAIVANQACVTKNLAFNVLNYNLSARIDAGISGVVDYPDNATILEDDMLSFKAFGLGGSGGSNYKVTWTGYNGSPYNGTFGPGQLWSLGTHKVTAKVCDQLFPTNVGSCATDDYTLTVDRTYLLFDGTNDYLQLGHLNNVGKGTSNVTFEMWINLRSSSSSALVSRATGDLYNSILTGAYNGYYEFVFGPSSYNDGHGVRAMPSGGIPTDTWVHVAYVISGNTYRIYQNGILLGSGTVGSRLTWDDNKIFEFGVDWDRSGGVGIQTDLFKGRLNELRVWNTARTQAQIQANMNQYLTGTELGLVGYWKFKRSDANASSIIDLTGKGFNARPINF